MPSIASASSLSGGLAQVRSYGSGTITFNTAGVVNEGTSITFTVQMNNWDASKAGLYYWNQRRGNYGSISGADFVDATTASTFTIPANGYATFTRTLVNDLTTEGVESFYMEVQTLNSLIILARSEEVYVADTSVNPYGAAAPSNVTIWPTSGTTANVTIYYPATNLGNPTPVGVKYDLYNYNTRASLGTFSQTSASYVSSNSSSVTITITGLTSGTAYDISPYFYNSYADGAKYANTGFTTWGQAVLVGSYIPIGASNVGVQPGSGSSTFTVGPGITQLSGAAIGAGGSSWIYSCGGGGGGTSWRNWTSVAGTTITLYAGNVANTINTTKPAAAGAGLDGGISAVFDPLSGYVVYANGGSGAKMLTNALPIAGNGASGGGGGAGGFVLSAGGPSTGGNGGSCVPSTVPTPAAAGAGGSYLGGNYGGTGGTGGNGYCNAGNVNSASAGQTGGNGSGGAAGGGGGGSMFLSGPTYVTGTSARGGGASLNGQSQSPVTNGAGGTGAPAVLVSIGLAGNGGGPGPFYGGGGGSTGNAGSTVEMRGAVRVTWGQEFGRPAYPNVVADA